MQLTCWIKAKKAKPIFYCLIKFPTLLLMHISLNILLKRLDVIEVDEQYKKLAEYLLGNVFIAENDEALMQ